MARRANYFAASKAITGAVAQTIIFTSSEIDSGGVIGYYLGASPAANDFQDFLGFRVRAGSQILIDLNAPQLLALTSAYSKSNFNQGTAGVTFQGIYIPLNLLDGPTDDAKDQCQFPPGAEAQVEIDVAATAGAGALTIGWETTNVPPRFFPRMIRKSTTSPVSTRRNSLSFTDSGMIRAVVMPTVGVDSAELTISGERAWLMPGLQFNALATGDILTLKDVDVFGYPVANAVVAPDGPTTYAVHSCDLGLAASTGVSNLVWDTGAAWTVNSSIAIYSVDDLANFNPSKGRYN